MPRSIPDSAMHILGSLQSGALYGYAIRKAVLDRTAGEIDLTFGTLYEQIGSLLKQGFIELDHQEVTTGGRTRKFYKLTAEGLLAYNRQLSAWKRYHTLPIVGAPI